MALVPIPLSPYVVDTTTGKIYPSSQAALVAAAGATGPDVVNTVVMAPTPTATPTPTSAAIAAPASTTFLGVPRTVLYIGAAALLGFALLAPSKPRRR